IEDHELPAVKPNAAAGHRETADGRYHPVLNLESDMPRRHIEHAVALAIDLAQQVAEMGTNVLAGDTNVAGVGTVGELDQARLIREVRVVHGHRTRALRRARVCG